MRNFCILVVILSLGGLSGCACMHASQPSEGVAIDKVINQIKQDLAKSSLANLAVGDGSIRACGDDNTPLTLMRDANTPPAVTLKLQTVRTVDVTGDVGVAKIPVLAVLLLERRKLREQAPRNRRARFDLYCRARNG